MQTIDFCIKMWYNLTDNIYVPEKILKGNFMAYETK